MARQILQVDGEPTVQDELPVILFSSHGQSYALLVDEFVGEQDLAVRPIDARLGKVPYVHASAILDDGSPVLILDVDDLRRGIDRMLDEGRLRRTDAQTVKSLRKKRKKSSSRTIPSPSGKSKDSFWQARDMMCKRRWMGWMA